MFLKRECIAIASIQEIWMKPTKKYKIRGYTLVTKCREEGFGGVGLLVREDVYFENVQLGNFHPLELVAIRTRNLSINFTIISLYAPPDQKIVKTVAEKIGELFKYLEKVDGELLLTGDFNARHPLWEEEARPCEKAKTIVQELDASKLILLNNGQTTTIPRINCAPTAIDLSFATREIAAHASWEVVQEEFGSTHLCIIIEFTLEAPVVNKGIPKDIIEWLFEYLRSRVIQLQTTESEILSVEANMGLPQGCPLSPLLFNLYTAGLHSCEETGEVLTQFADDFAVIVTADGTEVVDKANRYLEKFRQSLQEMNLSINPAKCVAINFSKIADTSIKLRLQNEDIQLQNTHKHLGFVVDRGMNYRKHIEDITNKSKSSLNLLKMISNRKSPANPETLLKIGNALIRSKLEYGSIIYGTAAKTNRRKLETILNAYVRVSMRYLRSTPVNVMLADSGAMPMEIRVEWLALKETIKNKHGFNPNRKFIDKTLEEEKNNETYMTILAEKHMDILYQMRSYNENMRTEGQRTKNCEINVRTNLLTNDAKKENISAARWKALATETITNDYQEFNKIYTDASKNANGVATAALDSQDQISRTNKINANVSITNAELIAIRDAIRICNEKNYSKAVIITDSKSACEMIKNRNTVYTNHIVLDIFTLIYQSQQLENQISIQWVPSHVGIIGNEKADMLAVQTTAYPQNNFETLTLGDTLKLAKKEIWNSWDQIQSLHNKRSEIQLGLGDKQPM
ncbi:uncharacterized protein LOC131679461 [Topomyia yanbarensis]|uniref:uncharacterized protein LOC131679461 n=1 Tax=Topomyia yanbarensis TaxID=2498891 RepID=UPI00273C7B7B|nr:uncharacterized protein LOC131679461 [Topomyia yanbarensis]